jgi:hypothetical protein
MPFDTPILVTAWNRPENLHKLFRSIKAFGCTNIFIYCDGPGLPGNSTNYQSVLNTIKLARDLQGSNSCVSDIKIGATNKGCRHAITEALDWFFTNVPEGIILEDDIEFGFPFLMYCRHFLTEYRDDSSIAAISGFNHIHPQLYKDKWDVCFSRYMHSWGWATWRTAWSTFDRNLDFFNGTDIENVCNVIFKSRHTAHSRWTNRLQLVKDRVIDSWAYIFNWSMWLNDQYSITPRYSLTRNIGFGESATHTKKLQDYFYFNTDFCATDITPPLVNIMHDSLLESCYYSPNLITRIMRKSGVKERVIQSLCSPLVFNREIIL